MSRTFAQIQADTRDLLGDAGVTDTWTPEQVQAAVNAAILNYCEKTGVTYVETSVQATSGGMVTLPTPALDVRRVIMLEPSFTIAISPATKEVLFDEQGNQIGDIAFDVTITRINGYTDIINVETPLRARDGFSGTLGDIEFTTGDTPCVLEDAPDTFQLTANGTRAGWGLDILEEVEVSITATGADGREGTVYAALTEGVVPDFSISVAPATATIAFESPESPATVGFDVTITRVGGYSEQISVSLPLANSGDGVEGSLGTEPLAGSSPTVLENAPDFFQITLTGTPQGWAIAGGLPMALVLTATGADATEHSSNEFTISE